MRTWQSSAVCGPVGDEGPGWSSADAIWADAADGVFLVASGYSPEPALFRTDLAQTAAEAARDAFRAAWSAGGASVEARLQAGFAAADARVREVAVRPQGDGGQWTGTAEMAVLAADGPDVWLAHIGTCRVYRAVAGAWRAHTQDHTFADDPRFAELPQADRLVSRRLGFAECPGPSFAREPRGHGAFLLATPLVARGLGARPARTADDPEAALAEVLRAVRPPAGQSAWWRTAIVAR